MRSLPHYAARGEFEVRQEAGVTYIETAHDQAFRKALLDGCPPQIRGKMREALAVVPLPTASAHSKRYFGAELDAILKRTAPLVDELDVLMITRLNLPGFKHWLALTNFACDYRMIKAFAAWADMVYAREAAEKAARESQPARAS